MKPQSLLPDGMEAMQWQGMYENWLLFTQMLILGKIPAENTAYNLHLDVQYRPHESIPPYANICHLFLAQIWPKTHLDLRGTRPFINDKFPML